MAENFSNQYQTQLNGAINNSVTSLDVDSVTGAPAVNFRIKIDSELMLVTAISTLTCTVTRGIEGTTAASHADNAVVTHVLTAGGLVQALADAVAGTPEDLGPYGDDFEGVALDAAWTLGGGATANFPDDHTVNLTFGAQKARMLRSASGLGANYNVKAMIRSMSDHGTSGGMTGVAFVDSAGDGIVSCFYGGVNYMFSMVDYAYTGTFVSGTGAPASGEVYWIEVEKVGTSYRSRWTSDPAGNVNWSAWSSAGTKTNTMDRIGLVRAYTNGGSITFRLDKFTVV